MTSKTGIKRLKHQNIEIVEFQHDDIYEYFLTAPLQDHIPIRERIREILMDVKRLNASVVSMDIFGKGTAEDLQGIDFPATWMLPLDSDDDGLGGIHVWAVGGTDVLTIYNGSQNIGVYFEDVQLRTCRLSGLGQQHPTPSRRQQVQEVFDQIEKILHQDSMDFSNVVRTWFYNNRILDWYSEFNSVRTTYFHQHHVTETVFPASTGIGAPNYNGTALSVGALAISGKNDSLNWYTVSSPLQDEACRYGSSFSRALEIRADGYRKLMISGTASIDRTGETVFLDDIDKQIDKTMEVTQAILEQQNMNWNDTVRAITYFKRPEYIKSYKNWCDQKNVSFPTVSAYADICRDNLLFEIELDAISTD